MMNEWVRKRQPRYTLDFYSTVKTERKLVISSTVHCPKKEDSTEIKAKKHKYCTISHSWTIQVKVGYMETEYNGD